MRVKILYTYSISNEDLVFKKLDFFAFQFRSNQNFKKVQEILFCKF